jgi:hypothetical protein
LFTLRAGPYSTSGLPSITSISVAASSDRLVSTPHATLNTSSVTSACAASRLARAMSATCTKSMVCLPSPRISGGWPASMRSIQRISTSV